MTVIEEGNHVASSAPVHSKADSEQEHFDPITAAAERNNMTVQEYIDAVRGFAAYVAKIIFSRE